jgi:hypothetical protein
MEPPPGGVWGPATGTTGTATAGGWDGTTGERCLELAVGLGKGVWDEFPLPVLGEREAIVARKWEPGKALLDHQILTRRRWPDS